MSQIQCRARPKVDADASGNGDRSQEHAGAPISGPIPFRGALLEQVREHVCERCWKDWLQMQIKIINELALNLGDPRSHDIIEAHARDFLGLADTPQTATDFASIGDRPPGDNDPD